MLMFVILEDSSRDVGKEKGADNRKLEDNVLVEIVSRSGLRKGLEDEKDERHRANDFLANDDLATNITPLEMDEFYLVFF